jgi:uncharacterized protein (DUF1697 family)
MPDLQRAFEHAGFSEVRTLLTSGNVLFTARSTAVPTLERKAEAAMQKVLGRTFLTIIRPVEYLRAILDEDPFRQYRLGPEAKRVVTFLRTPSTARLEFPVEMGGARILMTRKTEVYTTYQRGSATPDFMTLIERSFGKEVTTRTWETVTKAAR